jgi:hypothetical protein
MVCFAVPSIWAQEQERSLIDRLLRPNMELRNNAQAKKFSTKSAVTERRGTVGTFFLRPNVREKSFESARSADTATYSSGAFNTGSPQNASQLNRSARTTSTVGTSSFHDIRKVADANNSVADRSFAGERSFREEGKSQKSLNRQNPPLTIEQVRELLNKNK